MARAPGIVSINNYQQRTNPNGAAQPRVRAEQVAQTSNLIGDVGAAIGHVMEAREEDDARAYSARAVADATSRYAERAREVEAQAPDGWRDLTRNSNTAWAEVDDDIIANAPTDRARQYVSEHLGLLRSQWVMRQAERENDLRREWRLDDFRETTRTWGNVLAANPDEYQRARSTLANTVGDLRDINANDRRDLLANIDLELAGFAVEGQIARDPRAALAQLRGHSNAVAGGDAIAETLGAEITSRQRSPTHNAEVGGVPNSMHLTGEAVDLSIPERYRGMSRAEIEADVKTRLDGAGIAATEIIFEGDHIHVGWRGAEAAAGGEPIALSPDNPIARLSGLQRLRYTEAAERELERRQTTGNAELRERETTARALWEAGEQAPNAPSVEEVRAARGDLAAGEYQVLYETFRARSTMNTMGNEELSRIATTPALQTGTDRERIESVARRNAAQAVLTLRQTDPMRYASAQGLVPNEAAMADAITTGKIEDVGVLLRRRIGIAQEQRARLGADTPVNPLTSREAAQLRGMLDRLAPDQRLDALATLQQGASLPRSGDGGAYGALVRQMYSDDPAAMAGAIAFSRRASIETDNGQVSSRTAARRLMAGAAILNPPGVDTNANGQPERRRSTFNMPGAQVLEGAFQNYVGDAYAEDPQGYQRAFQAFRAYYAGAASEQGINAAGLTWTSDGAGGGSLGGDGQAVDLAGEAAQVAVGNIRQNAYGGRAGLPRSTYLPWGMNEDQFTNSLRMGWDGIKARYGRAELSDNPRDYDYARDEDGFYTLFYRGSPVADGEGDFVRVRPRLHDR